MLARRASDGGRERVKLHEVSARVHQNSRRTGARAAKISDEGRTAKPKIARMCAQSKMDEGQTASQKRACKVREFNYLDEGRTA
jgi:hypothetical protein